MARNLKTATGGKSKKSMGTFFKVFLAVVMVLCFARFIKQEISIYQIKQEQAATQQRIDDLKKQKAMLESERSRLDDPKYIEKLARDDYNMVGPNEVPLFVVEEKKTK